MKKARIRYDERGQNLVIGAINIAAIVTTTLALVLDGGHVLSERRRVQNAADAAAVAGAREVALGQTDGAVLSRIVEYADLNGADSVEARYIPGGQEVGQGAVPEGATGVVVTTTLQFPTVLAGIIGLDELSVSASAEARYGGVRSAPNLWPVAVHCDPAKMGDGTDCPEGSLEYGETYQLWGNQTGPGSYGWLDWNGVPVGNPELVDNLYNPPNSGTWRIGDLVPAGPGVQNSSGVRNALNWWLNKDPDERHITIIVYDYVQGAGANLKYHIWRFGEFLLTGYNFRGPNKWIQGEFLYWVEPSKDIDINQTAFGPFGVQITK